MGALADLRGKAADALTPGDGDDWDVHPLPVDAIVPPAFMLIWSDPWLTPATHCQWSARLDVICVSNRVDVEPGVEILETLVETAIARLAGAGLPAITAGRPANFEVGGLLYLASRLTLSQPVSP